VQQFLEQVAIRGSHGAAPTPAGWRHTTAAATLTGWTTWTRGCSSPIVQRRPGASICPSEAARAVGPEGWRDLMPAARAAAGRLAATGEVEVTQGGAVVDVATARGPVRVRRPR